MPVKFRCARVCRLDAADAPRDLNQDNVEQWDSLGHLRLVLAIEAEFGTTFHTETIPLLTSSDSLKEELSNVLR